MRPYYSLAVWSEDLGCWCVEFGDWSLDCVLDEAEDMLGPLRHTRARVVTTDGAQSSIVAAVSALAPFSPDAPPRPLPPGGAAGEWFPGEDFPDAG